MDTIIEYHDYKGTKGLSDFDIIEFIKNNLPKKVDVQDNSITFNCSSICAIFAVIDYYKSIHADLDANRVIVKYYHPLHGSKEFIYYPKKDSLLRSDLSDGELKNEEFTPRIIKWIESLNNV